MKYAILSMDIEDWYNLDYFIDKSINPSQTMIDGLDTYRDILAHHQIPSSYFVLGELINPLSKSLKQLAEEGADIGVHGWSHMRPLLMDPIEFKENLIQAKNLLEDLIQKPALGYRAPCFSLDQTRLDVVRSVGFSYDSSRILSKGHPLYGSLDLEGFSEQIPNVFRSDDFFEFQLSTLSIGRFNIPISGGGYIRIFPWFLMDKLIKHFLRHNQVYVLYIHPFELSRKDPPKLPKDISIFTRARFTLGLGGVEHKLHRLVQLLKAEKYEFITFADLRRRLMDATEIGGSH